jgi:D-glycero-alpha-D-manno-heptose 1-phosphate guanylyltransferase
MHEDSNSTELNSSPSEAGGHQVSAIILAGGLGTRLRSAVPDLPKCMAPVAGKPFLFHVINYLQEQEVDSFIFSLGYMHEIIEHWILKNFPYLNYQLAIEEEPLGTGGAIQLACKKASTENILILNGDTLFKVNTNKLLSFHQQHDSVCTLSLKPMNNFNRYGVVEINKQGYIQSFREKKFYEQGLINGGVYALNVKAFLELELPAKFSFEKDYLEIFCTAQKMMGLVQDEYFIDIGIPEDLEKAGKEIHL